MPESNVQTDGNGGGDLKNLFALAHLANLLAMAEEERGGVARTSPPMSRSPPTTATVATTETTGLSKKKDASATPSSNNMSSPQRQRPAKKRAMPADFDTSVAPCSGSVAATALAAANKTLPKTKAAKTSKPSAKRPRQNKDKSNQQRKGSISFKMKSNQPSFPVILMAIMSAPQNKEFMTFLSDGQKFIIIRPEAVARNVLPIHFEENVPTYDQFLHLLAIWGFDVVKDPQYPQVNVYNHPMFQNGDWEACLRMKLPDPNDQQVMSQARVNHINNVAEKNQVLANNNSRNDRMPEPPASPVPEVVAEANRPSPRTTVHSVTPPMTEEIKNIIAMQSSFSAFEAALLERAVTQTKFSNLGPKFSSMKESLMYRMRGQGMQDPFASLRQTKLQSSSSLGSPMMGYLHPSMKTGNTLPMNYRRVTVDGGTGGNYMSSSVMGNDIAMLRRMERMPRPFAGLHNGRPQPQQETHMPSQMMNTRPTPSDAEVRSATEDIVSAAIDALRPKSRRHTISHVNTSELDAMTDMFLERSMARLSSRPTAIMGPRKTANAAQQVAVPIQHPFLGVQDAKNAISRHMMMTSVGAEVEAYTKACLAARSEQQRRKVSILGNPSLPFGR